MHTPTTQLTSLSVFLPCYNEEKNIPLIVEKLDAFLPTIAKTYEIIIVNDGSTDRTIDIVNTLKKKHSTLRLMSHETNRGYGATLRTGFVQSRFDWIFFTDGDGQFDVTQLKTFVPFTTNFDVVIGYRVHRADGQLRAFNASLFKLFVDILFRVHVKDIDCAFKLIRADRIKNLPLESTGAFISSEFLYRFKKMRVAIKQLPVNHYPRKFGTPTGNSPKVIMHAGLEAIKLYLHMRFGLFRTSKTR